MRCVSRQLRMCPSYQIRRKNDVSRMNKCSTIFAEKSGRLTRARCPPTPQPSSDSKFLEDVRSSPREIASFQECFFFLTRPTASTTTQPFTLLSHWPQTPRRLTHTFVTYHFLPRLPLPCFLACPPNFTILQSHTFVIV